MQPLLIFLVDDKVFISKENIPSVFFFFKNVLHTLASSVYKNISQVPGAKLLEFQFKLKESVD